MTKSKTICSYDGKPCTFANEIGACSRPDNTKCQHGLSWFWWAGKMGRTDTKNVNSKSEFDFPYFHRNPNVSEKDARLVHYER